MEGCSLGMQVCHQGSTELLGVIGEVSVVNQVVLELCRVKLGAVPRLHFIFCNICQRKNTTSKGGGGASRGGHGVRARKSVL